MGKPRYTRKYPSYPKIKEIPGNTRSYISTLLPDPNPTCYPVFCPIPDPTRPDTEKPYPLGTAPQSSLIIIMMMVPYEINWSLLPLLTTNQVVTLDLP